MFTLDATIDAIQNGKKQFVNTFVQNESVKEALVKFVDAQSEYTKKAVKVGIDTATTLGQEVAKMAQEATKFDYAKFGEGFGKAFTAAKK